MVPLSVDAALNYGCGMRVVLIFDDELECIAGGIREAIEEVFVAGVELNHMLSYMSSCVWNPTQEGLKSSFGVCVEH